MTKLNPHAAGSALGVTFVISYVICALLVWLAPEMVIKVVNMTMHTQHVTAFNPLVLTDVLVGAVVSLVYGYLVGYVFAMAYDRFVK